MISTQDAATRDFFTFRFPVQTRKGIKADGDGEEIAAVGAADMAIAAGDVCAEDGALSFVSAFLKLESKEDTWLAMSRLAEEESSDAITVMSFARRFRYMAT